MSYQKITITPRNESEERFPIFISQIMFEWSLIIFGLAASGFMIIGISRFIIASNQLFEDQIYKSSFFVAIAILIIIVIKKSDLINAARTWLSAIDHALQRILSIAVLGIGETTRASKSKRTAIYYILISIAFFLAIKYFIEITTPSDLLEEILQSKSEGKTYKANLVGDILTSIKLSIGAVIAILPFRLILSKNWRALINYEPITLNNELSDETIPKEPIEWRIAQISDLHTQHPSHPLSETGGFFELSKLDYLANSLSKHDFEVLVISGDLTDDGSEKAWNTLQDSKIFQLFHKKIVFCPGNHDINTIAIGKAGNFFNLAHLSNRALDLRALRYLEVANHIMGSRTHALSPYSEVEKTLAEIMQEAAADIQTWKTKNLSQDVKLKPSELLCAIFPLRVSVAGSALTFCVWNTIRHNRWPLLNSLGEITDKQVLNAGIVLRPLAKNDPLIHVMHHHIGLPNTSKICSSNLSNTQKISEIGMTMSGVGKLIDFLHGRSSDTIILHGHHHKCFVGSTQENGIQLVSAPSATFGIEESYIPNIRAISVGTWLKLGVARTNSGLKLGSLEHHIA